MTRVRSYEDIVNPPKKKKYRKLPKQRYEAPLLEYSGMVKLARDYHAPAGYTIVRIRLNGEEQDIHSPVYNDINTGWMCFELRGREYFIGEFLQMDDEETKL